MKRLVCPMAFLLLIILSACAKSEKTSPVGPQPLPTPPPHGGTIDGGGGIGVHGRPLDSYHIDLNVVPEFKTLLQPMLSTLQRYLPALASDLNRVITARSWYMGPFDLDQIPGNQMGVFFPTDQIAIQNLSEVWIDQKLFEPMKVEDKAVLLLHELVMGVRLLAFSDGYEQCLVKADEAFALTHDLAKNEKDRAVCNSSPLPDLGPAISGAPKINLSDEDYPNIRYLTEKIYDTKGAMDDNEIKTWLYRHQFGLTDTTKVVP